MLTIAGEILIIFLLIVLNGVFAMSEIAVISANKTRLQPQIALNMEECVLRWSIWMAIV